MNFTPMRIRLLATFTLLALAPAFAAPPTTRETQSEFKKADAELNAVYQSVLKDLDAKHLAELRELQRYWLAARDGMASDRTWLNRVRRPEETGETLFNPRETTEYWDAMWALTGERVWFLRAYSGKGSAKGVAGQYNDGFGGELTLKPTPEGIEFDIYVVRGPTYHQGGLKGVAKQNGDHAVYREVLDPSEHREPCKMTFTFTEGHVVKVEGINTSYHHGARAYVDGTYYKAAPGAPKAGRP